MRRLIIADVHANLAAFETVLMHAGSCDEIIFLGDIIGWGPDPSECVDLLRETGAVCVMGNHDYEICVSKDKWHWNAWTFEQLSVSQRKWIVALPEKHTLTIGGRPSIAIHRAPAAYYFYPDVEGKVMAEAFNGLYESCYLCGHSHHGIERVYNQKRYYCIRSVGQLRDCDPRAGYSIEENGVITHYRVPYDIERTAHSLDKVGVDTKLLQRWKAFLRSGYDPEWSRLGSKSSDA